MNNHTLMVLVLCSTLSFPIYSMKELKSIESGYLVAIEGLNNSGKTTLAKNLYKSFASEGFSVITTEKSNSTERGKEINEKAEIALKDKEENTRFIIYNEFQKKQYQKVILPALNRNQIVICDEFITSKIACIANHNNIDMWNTLSNHAVNNQKPNITILIDIPVEIANERLNITKDLNYKNLSKEQIELKKTLTSALAEFVLEKQTEILKNLHQKDPQVIIVDGTKTPEELTNEVYNIIIERLKQKKGY